jgi:hypothetical protein
VQDHAGVFRALMEDTFGSFFSSGIHNLAHVSEGVIVEVFDEVDWSVEKTLSVEYEDLREVLMMMKQRVESGRDGEFQIKDLLSLLFMSELDLSKNNSTWNRCI